LTFDCIGISYQLFDIAEETGRRWRRWRWMWWWWWWWWREEEENSPMTNIEE